jgi:DNA recombination protein RmuC
MSGTTLVLALLAIAGCALGGWFGFMLGSARARARGLERLAGLEGEARAQKAAADELRRQLAATLQRLGDLEEEAGAADRERAVAETNAAQLRLRLDEERELLGEAERRLGDTFKALAAEALAANNQGFLSLAKEKLQGARQEGDAALEARQKAIEGLMAPVKESLDKVDGKIQELERERAEAYGRLMQQVSGLQAAQERLENQTGNLARALRSPTVRGRWGEIQLRRAVELAGMLEHCDFGQQVTLVGQNDPGKRLRPDMVVRLPAGRQVVVDAKAPLEGYLQAMEATGDDERKARLREHGAQVRAHLQKLSSKAYWSELDGTPEFVVMFLPGEGIFSAALEQAPGLLEEGAARRVLLATPTTLIALLQTVHYGWKQEKLAENAEKISEQGRALHERVATLVEHWSRLGLALGKATEHFNAAAASFEGRVLPAARRLEELGASSKKSIDELPRLDLRPRRQMVGAGGTLPLPELVE